MNDTADCLPQTTRIQNTLTQGIGNKERNQSESYMFAEMVDHYTLIYDQIQFFYDSLDLLSDGLTRDQSHVVQRLWHTLLVFQEEGRPFDSLNQAARDAAECQSVLDTLWSLLYRAHEHKLTQQLESFLEKHPHFIPRGKEDPAGMTRHELIKHLRDAETAYRTKILSLSSNPMAELVILDKCTLQQSLAMNLFEQGRIEEAKELFQVALEFRKKALLAQEPDTVLPTIDMALTLCKFRDLEGAAKISRALRTKNLGNLFQAWLSSLGESGFTAIEKIGSLAISLWNGDQLDEAAELQIIDLRLRERVLGFKDSRTLESADHLASMLRARGCLVEAEGTYRKLLSSRREILGETHHLTLGTVDRLVIVLFEQDKVDAARTELKGQALKICQKGFGPNLVGSVLRSKEDIFGKNHPVMLFAMDILAMALFHEGFHQEASHLSHQVLGLRQENLGPEHPETLRSMHIQGRYLAELNKLEDAESLLQKTLDLRTQVLDLGDPDTRQSLRRLVEVMLKRGEGKKAEDTCRQMLPLLSINLTEDPVLTDHLVNALRLQGKEKEAEDFRQTGIYPTKLVRNPSPAVNRISNEDTKRSDPESDQDSQHTEVMGVSGSPDEMTEGETTPYSKRKIRQRQRQYKTRTFQLPTRGEGWFMFAFELARILGFSGTSHLLTVNSLSVIVLGEDEVNALAEQKLIPFGGKRDLIAVTVESAFRQFGRRITHVQGSRHNDTSNTEDPIAALDEGDDILILKHKTSGHTLHFRTGSIENGLLTVGDVRTRAAVATWWGQERHRVTLYFQGRRLRHDRKTCQEEGLTVLSEVECITNATSKRSGDSLTGVDRSNSYNMLGPLAPLEEDTPSLHHGGLASQPSITATADDPASPHFISAESLNELLQICPLESLLLLDLRDEFDYQTSHVSGASNICVPSRGLSQWQALELENISKLFTREWESKKSASRLAVDYIIAYDANSSQPSDLLYFRTYFKLMTLRDWKGTLAVLRGGFASFAKKFPQMVSGILNEKAAAASPPTLASSSTHAANNRPSDSLGMIEVIEESLRIEGSDPMVPDVLLKEDRYADVRGLLVGHIDSLHALKLDSDDIAIVKRDVLLEQCLSNLDSLDAKFREAKAIGDASVTGARSETVVESVVDVTEAPTGHREDQVTEFVEIAPAKHLQLIGARGDNRRGLEQSFKVSIDIPKSSRQDPQIKITGQLDNVRKAKQHILKLIKDQVDETIMVPRNKHHFISDHGQLFRRLRNNQRVTVDHAGHRPPPKNSSQAQPHVSSINDHSWEIVDNSKEHSEEGDIPWVLHGSTENIAQAREIIQNALSQSHQLSHTEFLVLPDPEAHRFVIGPGGAQINAIRKQTGCKISVPRNQAKGEAIVITGSPEGVEQAKKIILDVVKTGGAVETVAERVEQKTTAESTTSRPLLYTDLASESRVPETDEKSSLRETSHSSVSKIDDVSNSRLRRHVERDTQDDFRT